MTNAGLPRIDDDISFRKLEVLLAFMDTGNLARAAERLGTSAVSVHRALHSLEEGARCALFRHQGRNLIPTEAAQVLAEVAREVLGSMAEGLRATRAAAGHADGRIKLGSLYSLTIQLVPEVIVGLRQRRPNLQAELVLGSNAELLEKLRQGTLDATLMALPDPEPGIVSLPLLEDDMYFAAPLGSPYAALQSIDLRNCAQERFVSLGEGFATQRGFRGAFEVAGFAPEVAMQVGDIFSLANLVSGGVGYTLLPGRVRSIFGHKLQFIALEEKYRARQSIGLSFLKPRERDPDLLLLASVCRVVVGAGRLG
ncbi:LysR family transcriptional regulator [Xylophilus sp. GW821-FHT01B05]